jgi:hypothetical protein|tara:strand:- start:224 stop:613 length:390 start_codon:yes stop_codon:yes gene_type:complete
MSFFDKLAGKRQPMFPTPNLPSMPVNPAPRPITMPIGPMTPVASPQRSVKDFSMGKDLPSSPSISLPSIPSIPSIEISEEVDTTAELNALLQRKRQLEAELQLVNEQIAALSPFQGGRTGIAGLFGGGD